MYSRIGYVAIKKETTAGTVLKPDVFIPVTKLDVTTEYKSNPSVPILANRTKNINPIKDLIDGPSGKMAMEIEPLTFGHMMKAVYGALTSGVYFPMFLRLFTGSVTGTPAIGATLLQATSLATGTITALVSATSFDVRDITIGFDATHVVTGTNIDGTTFTMTPSATLPAGAFTVGETITGATSSQTAVILAVSTEKDYLLVGTISGAFTIGETFSGGSSSKKATLGTYASTVYGHEGTAPQTSLPTYTLEIGLENEAYRFGGVSFNDFSSVAHKDNIITAEVAIKALLEFKHARVQAQVTTGSSKTITLDQTTGLTASDTIKVFRPRTGAFLDFSGSSVKTSAISSITSETALVVATIQTQLEVGDLIMLAPQTPSYSLANEFSWIGGSVARTGDTMTEALGNTASLSSIEEFELSLMNEMESRHAANGTNLVNRFPAKNHLKKFAGSGKLKKAYLDQTFLDRMRNSTLTSLQVRHQADLIGATSINYLLDWRIPELVFKPWNPSMESDALLEEDMAFELYRNTTSGYSAKALLVNTVSSY